MRGVEKRKPLNKEGESKILNENLKARQTAKNGKTSTFPDCFDPLSHMQTVVNVGLLELCHVNDVERIRFVCSIYKRQPKFDSI